ncbi:MAG: class I SAM-dependent rRNA methyltransferase [Planctomycetota bacterium]|jgi:23S rRNA (cytosine1962-C5)-methyltransferase
MVPSELRLTEKDAEILRNGHPWLFHGKRYSFLRRATPGNLVDCVDPNGHFVARGLVDNAPPIGVRVLTLDPNEHFDESFIRGRIARALAHRKRWIDTEQTTAYRWINGEGDGLPGVVVDRYGDYAGLQVYTESWHPHLDALVRGLQAVEPSLAGVVTRDRIRRARLPEAAKQGTGDAKGDFHVLAGEAPPEELAVTEHGVKFLASLDRGQKTGLYLDQRENRVRLRHYCAGADMLNCFSYTGGFGLHAAIGGAARTTNCDLSKKAQQAARKNYAINGLDPKDHRFPAEDCFVFLGREKKRGNAYDVVLTDPPSFATSKKSVFSAVKGYKRLTAAALDVLKPGGIYVAASCTAQISLDEFWEAVRDGAAEAGDGAGVPLRVIEQHGLPVDHPVPVAFPEGRYLKFLICVRD